MSCKVAPNAGRPRNKGCSGRERESGAGKGKSGQESARVSDAAYAKRGSSHPEAKRKKGKKEGEKEGRGEKEQIIIIKVKEEDGKAEGGLWALGVRVDLGPHSRRPGQSRCREQRRNGA